jgi:hypothetical protein
VNEFAKYRYTNMGYNKGFEDGWYSRTRKDFPSMHCGQFWKLEYESMKEEREKFNGF